MLYILLATKKVYFILSFLEVKKALVISFLSQSDIVD